MQRKRKLTRSSNRIVLGVLGGIAEYFGVDKTLVRVLFAALSIFPGHLIAGVLIYLLLTIFVPDGGGQSTRPRSDDGGRKTLHDVTEEDHRGDTH